MSKKHTVAVVGAGMMGSGIAARAALAGHPVALIDTTLPCAHAGMERALACIRQLAENGLADPEQVSKTGSLIEPADRIDPYLDNLMLVIEAIPEKLELKQQIFEQLDSLTSPDVILASNTSSLQITEIARSITCPERAVTAHFWYPAHLVPLVEIVMGERTSEETALRLRDLLRTWDKAPVIVRRDLPGQLANRILQAVIREATNIVDMGLASAEDVDTAVKMGMALRFPVWGPLEHIDGVGLDLALAVQQSVLPSLDNRPEPVPLLRRLVDEGHLGHKTGSGFYDWSVKDMDELAAARDRFIMVALAFLKDY